MKERVRLNIDIDALLPGDNFQIGNQTILIRPLSIIQYKFILSKIKGLFEYTKELGITSENYRDNDKFIMIAEIIVEKFPELLEEVSNIAAEDLQQLPIEIIISLIDKCLDVNLKSKESLVGNFRSLALKVQSLGLDTKSLQATTTL